MSQFKKVPDSASSDPLLPGPDEARSIADIAWLAIVAYWPTLLGLALFIGFRLAGKRLYGSICIGLLALVQLWIAGVLDPA